MELELIRTYHTGGTNGAVYLNNLLQCYTIELPWKNNEHKVSCIPEGKYAIRKRFNRKFGAHFMVMDVKDREDILIHPANNALKELEGCIAPVTELTGEGEGSDSRIALEGLKQVTYDILEKETVFIIIKS